MKTKHELYGLIFGTVYIGLMTNLLLTLSCAPALAVLLFTNVSQTWPLLTLLAPVCAPGLVGAFAVLRAFSQERSTAPIATFVRAWRAAAPRALAVGGLGTVLMTVLVVDMVWAWHRGLPMVVGVLGMLAALALASGVLVLATLSERPDVRLGPALRACAYLAMRRWYLTGPTLALLAFFETLLAFSPLAALGIAATPVLYLVWANSRFTLRPVLDDEPVLQTGLSARKA